MMTLAKCRLPAMCGRIGADPKGIPTPNPPHSELARQPTAMGYGSNARNGGRCPRVGHIVTLGQTSSPRLMEQSDVLEVPFVFWPYSSIAGILRKGVVARNQPETSSTGRRRDLLVPDRQLRETANLHVTIATLLQVGALTNRVEKPGTSDGRASATTSAMRFRAQGATVQCLTRTRSVVTEAPWVMMIGSSS
jgi:hypothetical protein